tara:strand:- start:5359 stop:7284 length:1926 start_codon:yes stop_codon:yes gene_type:complete
MAKNYTISTFKTTEVFGDSLNNNTMPENAVLTIKPKKGYVIKASDFRNNTDQTELPYGIIKVTFADSGKPDTLRNTVLATVWIDPNFVMPNNNVKWTIDFDGKTTLYKSILPESTFFIEDYFVKNNKANTFADITVTSTGGSTVTKSNNFDGVQLGLKRNVVSKDINYVLEKEIYSIKTTHSSANKKVASIHISADTNHYFNERPYLKTNSASNGVVTMKLTKTTKDTDGFITDYYYDVFYKNSRIASIEDNVRSVLIYNAVEKESRKYEIIDIDFGSSIIDPKGEKRKIVIQGTSGSTAKISIIKKSTNSCILSSDYINSSTSDSVVGEIDAYEFTLPEQGINRKGKKKINQKRQVVIPVEFPSATRLTTTVTSDMSSTATMNLADTTGLTAKDKLVFTSPSNSAHAVDYTADVTIDSINSATQVTLSQAISATKGDVASFIQSDEYYINIDKSYVKRQGGAQTDFGSNIQSKTPFTHTRRAYNYLLTQSVNPILKITATESNANLNSSGAATVTRVGIAHTMGDEIKKYVKYPNKFSVSWSLVAHNSHNKVRTDTAGSVDDDGVMSFSNTDSTASDWTNSVTADNGGTELRITNIFQTDTSTAGADTYLIKFDVEVIKWGTQDVTMNVNLDDIVTTYSG